MCYHYTAHQQHDPINASYNAAGGVTAAACLTYKALLVDSEYAMTARAARHEAACALARLSCLRDQLPGSYSFKNGRTVPQAWTSCVAGIYTLVVVGESGSGQLAARKRATSAEHRSAAMWC